MWSVVEFRKARLAFSVVVVLPGGERPANFLFRSRENPADDSCLLLFTWKPMTDRCSVNCS